MINGKTLRKSLSLLLTVLMLASVCAVCFGTFASAYTAVDATLYDFNNKTGLSGHTPNNNPDGATLGIQNSYKTEGDNSYFNITQVGSGGNSLEFGYPDTVTDVNGNYNPNGRSLMAGAAYTVTFKYRFNEGTLLYPATNPNQLIVSVYNSANAKVGGLGKDGVKNAFPVDLSDPKFSSYVEACEINVVDNKGTTKDETDDTQALTTLYKVTEQTEWFTASITFNAKATFGATDQEGVYKDRLCLVFTPFGLSYRKDAEGNDIPFLLNIDIDDVVVEASFDDNKKPKTFVYDWKNEDGTAAYANDHNVIALAGTPANAGITEAMKNTSGITSMGMIIGGGTSIPRTMAPSSAPRSDSWFHKASVFDDASKALGNPNAVHGSVRLEAGTSYIISVKYIPLTIYGGKTISFGVGGFDIASSTYETFDVKGNIQYTSAAYTQTTADDVADRDTFDNEGNVIKAAAEEYIAENGWQEYTIAFTTSADYAPTHDVYLALNAATNGSDINTAGKCWLAQFLVESVTVTVADDEYVLVTEDVEGVETIKPMLPGDKLLPAPNNSLGEASIGWIDETGAAIKTVPSENVAVYATYPSTVIDFESGKGYADYNCAGDPTGIVADPDDANNKVFKLISGAVDGAYNWIPAKTAGIGASIDTATTAYELKPNTRYKISLKCKVEAGSANAAVVLYRAQASDKSGKVDLKKFNIVADSTNGTLIEGSEIYAFNERTDWYSINYEIVTPAELGNNNHICFVNTQHGVSGYTANNIYYFDDVVIEEVSAANEIYKTPVEDAKTSLRKEAAGKTAGLRFRGELDGDLVAGADEVGFVGIVSSLIEDAEWYKLEGADMTANKGKLASNAQYVKVENFKDATGYYDYVEATGNYQYQLCFTGINSDTLKDTEFTVVMYVKTGDTFTYKYVKAISYNTVKQVYEANGIFGY